MSEDMNTATIKSPLEPKAAANPPLENAVSIINKENVNTFTIK